MPYLSNSDIGATNLSDDMRLVIDCISHTQTLIHRRHLDTTHNPLQLLKYPIRITTK